MPSTPPPSPLQNPAKRASCTCSSITYLASTKFTTMTLPKINIFYHFWFQWLDPFVLVTTVYALIFTPQVMLDAFIPPPLSAYDPNQGFLVHQLAALFAFVALILGGVLRISNDIKVWRFIIASILVVDVAMLASLYASLKQQDRLSLGAMRSADWSNVIFTGFVTAVRTLSCSWPGLVCRTVPSRSSCELGSETHDLYCTVLTVDLQAPSHLSDT